MLNKNSRVLDVGCGTGRWTKYVCSRCGHVEAIDPSKAVLVAEKMLESDDNVRISQAEVDNIPFEDNSFDFVFSLGVLHHIPDTADAMKKCVEKLKPDGHFLVYLYYSFENRGFLFRSLFHLSTVFRTVICKLPSGIKKLVCDFIAVGVYFPLAFLSRILKPLIGKGIKKLPLSYYHDKTFNVMRNDSLDRFGTPLEQRFSKAEITEMMQASGLTNIQFSENEPYWHAVGQKK
jgi:ubiquinone/menaquinone biosynthesis C-methylase UbiE